MKRQLLISGVAYVVVVLASCSDRKERACQVDTDCPEGSLCQEGACGPANSDAGPAPVEAGPTTCSSDGVLCGTANECCSGSCTDGRCGAAAPPPETPTCRKVYELCQNDCCEGLTCVAGACR